MHLWNTAQLLNSFSFSLSPSLSLFLSASRSRARLFSFNTFPYIATRSPEQLLLMFYMAFHRMEEGIFTWSQMQCYNGFFLTFWTPDRPLCPIASKWNIIKWPVAFSIAQLGMHDSGWCRERSICSALHKKIVINSSSYLECYHIFLTSNTSLYWPLKMIRSRFMHTFFITTFVNIQYFLRRAIMETSRNLCTRLVHSCALQWYGIDQFTYTPACIVQPIEWHPMWIFDISCSTSLHVHINTLYKHLRSNYVKC